VQRGDSMKLKRRQFLKLLRATILFAALPKPPVITTPRYICCLDDDDIVPKPFIVGVDLAGPRPDIGVVMTNVMGEVYISRNFWSDDVTWERVV